MIRTFLDALSQSIEQSIMRNEKNKTIFALSRRAYHFAAILTILFLMVSVSPVSAQYDLFGYGRNATGGGNATPILVDTEQELLDALSGTKSDRVVIITANITVSTQFTAKGSNITLLALPGRCLISNGQSSDQSGILNMRGSNIIIRNVTFIGPGAYDCNGKDLLQFEDATNAWVDHCDFQDGCDGNFDIKSESDNITVTWCRFRYLKPAKAGGSGGSADHRFTNLLGSSSSDKPTDGTYNVSYAYNWWDNGCKERMVRCRNCEIHFFNCYWNSDVANYYVGPENATCYFEGCTFAGNANSPEKIFKSYGGTNACRFVNSVGNLPSNQGTVNTPSYSYSVASASEAVASITDANCGAGATLLVDTDGSITTCGANLTKYTVTFNLNGKGTNFTQEVYENRTIAAPATPTTSGFVFGGWYTNQSCTNAFDFSTPITANRTLYAKWVQAMTVTFNLNGKGTNFTQEVVSGGKASVPSNPTAAGYIFAGWYTDQACTTEYDFNTTITAAKTIYAKWEESNNCYEFTLATTGAAPAVGDVILGTGVGGTMTMLGGTIEYSSNGLAFKSSSASKVSVALLTEMQVGTVITLNIYNGSTGDRGLKLADGTGDVIDTYTQDGVGDYSASYIVTAGDGLAGTSVFEIHRANNSFLKSVTVSNCGDGEPDPTPDPEPDPEPDPTPGGGGDCPESGEIFSWSPKTGLGDADIKNGTYDLPGNWLNSVNGGKAQMYVPSYGNMRIRGSQLAYNANNSYIHVTLDCPLQVGDVILINSSKNTNDIYISTSTTRPTGDSNAAAHIIQGTEYVLQQNNALVGLKEFYVWRKGSTTQVGLLTITRPTSSTPVTTTITLSSQGGTGGTTEVTATKDEAMPEITIPTRTGYNFQGYFTANGGTGTKYYNADGTSAKNWDKEDAKFTLIAYWTAKTYTVTLDANGGNGGTESVTATYGSAMPTITPATKVGYTLTGYFDAASGGVKYYNADGTSAKNWDKTSATTLYAQWECTAPTNVVISGEYIRFPGETLTLTVSGENITGDATYTWKKGDQVIAGQTTVTLTINNATITDAGNYTCTVSNGTGCEATANYTVKMYSLRGLIDWSTDCAFTKVNATTATYSMELAGSSSYEFKIFDGNVYYGNEGDNPTMTSSNCTNWPMKENIGNNVTLQTTASGTYTFTLDYSDASNLKISVTYPTKRIVYLKPDVWANDNPKFAVHAWHGSTVEDILMTKIDDCNNRNIYFVEIDAAHTHVIFIRGNGGSYNITNPWQNVWNQTGDLTIDNVQYNIGSEWNFTKASWTSFTPNYSVTFDANGHGTAPEAQCVAKNGKATQPTAPTATGYTFGGWYKEAGCTNEWDFATDVVTSNITLYAKWNKLAEDYTLSYNSNQPSAWSAQFAIKNIPAEQTLTGGTGNVSNNTPVITDGAESDYWIYEFNAWNTAADGSGTSYAAGAEITIAANTTLYAQWTPRTFNITYYDTDRTTPLAGLTPTSYTYGTGATLPTPTKTGYTFTGWILFWTGGENDKTAVSTGDWGDVQLAAQWTENAPVTPEPEPEGTCWNISDAAFNNLDTIETTQTVNGLNIVATSKENIVVDTNNKTIEGYDFTHRLKLSGTGKQDSRHLKFAVTGACTIDVYLMSGKSTDVRTLNVATGSFGSNVTELTAGTTIAKQTYEYTGGATDIYMYSASSGINIYQICVTYPATPDPGTQYAVTHTLSNVTATAGATGAEAATEGAAYAATFEAATGFVLPNTINVTIGGATQAAGTGYTWNPETGVLNIPADKVKGDIVITIAGQVKAPELICEELFYVKTKTTSQFDTPRTGTVVSSNLSSGADITGVDGFKFSVKPTDSNPLVISPKDGETFQAGDKITVWVYNSGEKTMGFKLKSSSSITAKVPAKTLYAVEATLVAGDITTADGNTTIVIGRTSADDRWVAVQVERCVEESCTEPSTILAITANPVTVQASQTAAISVTGGNEGPIAFTVTPATGAVTGNDGAYSFSATEVGEYVIKATQADFNGVCGGNATCVISVTAIGSLTAPTITATDLNENTADAFTFCETDNDDALKVVATSPEEGVTYAYQWYVKETDSNVFTAITGATEAIYPPTMDGIYYCEVTAKKPGYASASAKSKEWTITITQSTAIISQPTSVALEGGQATLEVEAEGENLQYQWYSCEDDDKTNAQAIAGATHASYTTTQTGYYYVVVKSDCGVDRTSDVVEVTKEVVYCFNMTDLIKAKTTKINSQSELTSTHATITGGTVLYDRVAGETMELSENGLKFNSNSDYLKVTLTESALTNGTVIEFTYYVGSTGRGIKILKSDKTTAICSNAKTGTSGKATYSFTITEEMQEEVFYIARVGGTAYLQSLSVSNCGAVCSDNTPTLSASTTDISTSTSVTLTASNYTEGATLSFYKEGVAEPLQTGTGNTCTVTVDVTSTFYVVAVKDCERRSSSVTVTFTCGTPQPKIIQVGGVLGCNETVTLKAVTQEGADITEGTLQWYKNGVAIAGANAANLELNLEDVGEYTVSLTKGCMAMSTNTAVVSNEVPEPELEVLAPRQYYQLNHDYTEEQQLRYLMKLTLPEGTDVAGATDGAYQITATLEENTLDATQFVENKFEEGVYWIMLNLNSLTANADTYGLAAGDIISIKVTPLNLCGEYPAELAHTVEVKVTDKPTLAFIVSGADGNGTKEKKSHKVNGDFLTGYNKADLCLQTGTTSFDNTQELPLYTYLKEYFEVVPVNGYAPYNYYNYDPFDIALLTDFPKTKAGVGNDTLISAANLNALADLVDRKPLLSLKTHMVNTALGAWSEKGFIENPLTTKNQVNMTLLCHAHEMFKEDITIAPDDEGNVQVDILTQVGFDANKGVQGFRALASTNFINIATTVNSADNTNLVACCERQANVQARMLLLSINADATSFISDNGKIVIRNALHYLLQTDPTHVSDCSIVFDNGGGVGRTVTLKGTTYTSGDNEWGNPANWSTSTLPNQANNVLIEADCQVTNKHAQSGVGVYGVANVRINENYTLTIAPTGGVVSTGLFAVYKPGEKYSAKQITDPKYVTVQANETNTGLLMHSHQETLHATVQMYSPANHDKEGGYNTAGFHKVKNYTDVAVPVEVDAAFFQNNGHEAQYWKWNEKGTVGFERQTTGTVPHFQGGCISHCDPQLFSFTGQVALAKDHPYEMTYTEGGWYGINVVGNSWTAPIQILELTAADFGSNLEQTIYIYNTGHDATGTGVASQTDFSTPGQWMAIPIETAKAGDWAGPKVIPAMQAFQVLTLYPLVTPEDGETQAESQTLTIGYNKHIRCRGAVNGLTQKLYAPQRPKKAPRTGLPSTAEVLMPDPNKVDTFVTPTMLRVMFVADSVKTDVYLFEDDQRFKNGFDNGWDGTYQNDETVSGAYVLTEAGNMAISAQPYLEGTTVALKSKKTTTFQCTFKYTGTETLYLNDTKLEQSTKIEEGASYVFMASPEDAPNRFVISAEPYQGSITGMAGVVMVDNALVVNNPLQEPLRVFIYDAVGRTHHVYDTKAAMEEINLPNVPGVYLIRVKGENTDLVHKVVR